MEFCPKCKTLMLPSRKTTVCPKCGARTKADKSDIVLKEKISHAAEKMPRKVSEIESTMPIADAECPKCSNKKAFWWTQQVVAGMGGEDTQDTEFFRCTKCRHTWRKTA
jgi:DNA-directed RNA polymerase subunit M